MVNRKFSDDFILINADKTAKDAFNLITKFSPKYIVISREDFNEHFHYAIKPKFFKRMLENWKDTEDPYSMTLKDFMELHEGGQNPVVNTQTISEEPNTDPEIMEISAMRSDRPTIIYNNDIIVGVVGDDDDAEESTFDNEMSPDSSDLEMVALARGLTRGVSKREVSKREVSTRRGSTRRGPTPKGSTRRGSTRRGSTPKGSTPKGSTPKGSTPKGSTPKGSTKNNKGAKTVKKYPTATLPDQITINEPAKFEIMIKNSKSEGDQESDGIILEVGDNEKNTILTVIANSEPPGFVEFPNGFVDEMKVPLTNKNSKPLVFDILPKKEGRCTITAQFYHKNIAVGRIGIKSKIIPNSIDSQLTSGSTEMDIDLKKLGPDLSLLIREVHSDTGYKFEILVQSLKLNQPLKIFKPEAMRGDVEEQFRVLSADLANFGEDREGNDLGYDYQRIEDNVADKGKLLYKELFPKKFRNFFWEHKDNIKSIQVISEEPWVPWEIIKPVNDDTQEEEKFWCENYAFTRWIEDIDFKPKLKIKKIKVILPKDTNLVEAKKEVKWINTFAQGIGVDVTRDSTYEQVMTSLKNGGFDLLHITTHGLYNENFATMSHIELEGQVPFTLESISGKATAFGKEHPLVILNACETGQQGFALTGTQSWAKVFLRANAFAFIGTLWSVGDITAKEFTKSLYEKLHNKKPLDEAVRMARIEAKQRGDVSWLSYTLYAPSNTPIPLGN